MVMMALVAAGVPAQPTGRLNTDNALFMTHPINGLDDLLHRHVWCKTYASRTANGLEQATREQLFREFSVQHLACRHADPNAALGALGLPSTVRPSPLITLWACIFDLSRKMYFCSREPYPRFMVSLEQRLRRNVSTS